MDTAFSGVNLLSPIYIGASNISTKIGTTPITQEDVEVLRNILLEAVRTHEATLGIQDTHGQRYELDFMMNWQGHQALVRSVWNIRPREQHPRLVTCYPLKERQE